MYKQIRDLKCGDLIVQYNKFGEYMIFISPNFKNELYLIGTRTISVAIFFELDKNSNYAKFFVKSKLGYLDMNYYNDYMFSVLND